MTKRRFRIFMDYRLLALFALPNPVRGWLGGILWIGLKCFQFGYFTLLATKSTGATDFLEKFLRPFVVAEPLG